jgi:5'-3' exonuclease
MGDKSDNISSVLKKCGPKTAAKYFEDRVAFEKQIEKENAGELLERNRRLVSFSEIPVVLQEEFYLGLSGSTGNHEAGLPVADAGEIR